MKKLIVVICAAAMAAFVNSQEYLTLTGTVVTNASPAICESYMDVVLSPTAVTNLVIAYEIVESRMEPCACPDGYAGCLVQHYRRVSGTRYEKAMASMPEVYVLQGTDTKAVLEWMARRDSNDVAAVSLPAPYDEQHPVGFIDLRAAREVLRNAAVQKACAYEILPSRP